MEIIICAIFLMIFIGAIYDSFQSTSSSTMSIEEVEKENREIERKKKIKKEYYKLYKKYTEKEIKQELANLNNDYTKLIELARDEYTTINKGDFPIHVDINNNLIDVSYYLRETIDYSLATKYEVLDNILEKNLFSLDVKTSVYSINGRLIYSVNGKNEKIEYTANLKFDVDDETRIGFVYNKDIAKKYKHLGTMAVILYDYINDVTLGEDKITVKIKHARTMQNYVKNAISSDCKVLGDYILITLNTDTPREIFEQIKSRIK